MTKLQHECNVHVFSDAPTAQPSKGVTKQAVSYEEWIPGQLAPPSQFYGIQAVSPAVAPKEPEQADAKSMDGDQEYGFGDLEDSDTPSNKVSSRRESILSAASHATRASNTAPNATTSFKASPLKQTQQVEQALVVPSEPESSFYGSPAELRPKDSTSKLTSATPLHVYGSPNQFSRDGTRPVAAAAPMVLPQLQMAKPAPQLSIAVSDTSEMYGSPQQIVKAEAEADVIEQESAGYLTVTTDAEPPRQEESTAAPAEPPVTADATDSPLQRIESVRGFADTEDLPHDAALPAVQEASSKLEREESVRGFEEEEDKVQAPVQQESSAPVRKGNVNTPDASSDLKSVTSATLLLPPHIEFSNASSLLQENPRAPLPPERPSLQNAPTKSAEEPKKTKDSSLYEFPVVIGFREGTNPIDVFEWARGKDVLLPPGGAQPPWLFGPRLSRREVERMFETLLATDGLFLVRERATENMHPSYAISIVVAQHVEHHIIDVYHGSYSLEGTYNIQSVKGARSLAELVRALAMSTRPGRPAHAVCIPYIKADEYNRPEWLHGMITREEANYRLCQDDQYIDGRFLVRLSSKQQGNQSVYVVSLVFQGQFHHQLVSTEKGVWFLNGHPLAGCKSLSDVVHWMMSEESGQACALLTYIPCPPPYHKLRVFDTISSSTVSSPPLVRPRVQSTSIARPSSQPPLPPIPQASSVSPLVSRRSDPAMPDAAARDRMQPIPAAKSGLPKQLSADFLKPPATATVYYADPNSGPVPRLRAATNSMPAILPPSLAPPIAFSQGAELKSSPVPPPLPAGRANVRPLNGQAAPLGRSATTSVSVRSVHEDKKFENVYADANALFYDAEDLIQPGEVLIPVPDAPPLLKSPTSTLSKTAHMLQQDESC